MIKYTYFHEIEHTADWALYVRGDTLPEIFVHAAIGMYSLTITTQDNIQPQIERAIEVSGFDVETLLVNWLSELLYYTETEDLVFGQFEISQFTPQSLRAIARGQTGIPQHKHIKAVTFHKLRIVADENGYEVTIVFDV